MKTIKTGRNIFKRSYSNDVLLRSILKPFVLREVISCQLLVISFFQVVFKSSQNENRHENFDEEMS